MTDKSVTTSQIKIFLKQPYPYYYRGKELLAICILLFVMSLGFNYFFEPFHVNTKEHKMDYFWICAIHAIVAPIILILMSVAWPRKLTEENWVIKNEILFLILALLLIGLGQFLIRDLIYDNPDNWSMRYVYEEIRNTFLVGTLFIVILIPLNFTRLNAKYIKTAGVINSSKNYRNSNEHTQIKIESNLKDDDLIIDIDNLLFAKAEGNYVEFYIKKDTINRIVKRTTMKDLEITLSEFSNILKTHRSYLVNLFHVEHVTGNAQGYKLNLKNYDELIPVSRNMIEKFNHRMAQL